MTWQSFTRRTEWGKPVHAVLPIPAAVQRSTAYHKHGADVPDAEFYVSISAGAAGRVSRAAHEVSQFVPRRLRFAIAISPAPAPRHLPDSTGDERQPRVCCRSAAARRVILGSSSSADRPVRIRPGLQGHSHSPNVGQAAPDGRAFASKTIGAVRLLGSQPRHTVRHIGEDQR